MINGHNERTPKSPQMFIEKENYLDSFFLALASDARHNAK